MKKISEPGEGSNKHLHLRDIAIDRTKLNVSISNMAPAHMF